MIPFPNISIVVPFYGKNIKSLINCLNAIEKQSYPRNKKEIIVVDNNNKPIVNHQIKTSVTIKIFHEPLPGSYAARNKGIEEAKGDVIAFTDSDCLPHNDWLRNGIKSLQEKDFNFILGGSINFIFKKSTDPNLYELIDSIIHLRQAEYVTEMKYVATANLIVKKAFFDEYNGFDNNYLSGGDREWCNRLTKHGVELKYVPEAIVFHPARRRLSQLLNKNRRAVGSDFVRLKSLGINWIIILKEQKNAYLKRVTLIKRFKKINYLKKIALRCLLKFIYIIRYAELIKLLFGGKMTR